MTRRSLRASAPQCARAAGAAIVSEIEQHGYRAYQADDLEGYRWTFAQARPTMEVLKVT